MHYVRFSISARNVEILLHERGIDPQSLGALNGRFDDLGCNAATVLLRTRSDAASATAGTAKGGFVRSPTICRLVLNVRNVPLAVYYIGERQKWEQGQLRARATFAPIPLSPQLESQVAGEYTPCGTQPPWLHLAQ